MAICLSPSNTIEMLVVVLTDSSSVLVSELKRHLVNKSLIDTK